VKLGTGAATVVGVMPEGYGFPVRERIWTPLRADGSTLAPRTGPAVSVFGRLSPGASMDDARAELGAIGARAAALSPETHRNLKPRVTDPEAFAARLRAVAADVDPTIRLTDVQPLARVGGGEAAMNWTLTSVAWLVSSIVLLLAATGIHSLMSFTVARRTREIGIRAALGAGPGRIVAGIFSRAFLQVGAGVLAGSGLAALLGLGSTREVLLLLAADATMLLAGMIACAVPLRRALRIDPTEALRAEG
jgi:hypothetical protein